jgi:hypothetical protein
MVRSLLIIVVSAVLIGGGVVFVVPNLLGAMQRSHQKRCMADVRTIATAWEARETDVKTYSIGAKGRDPIDATRIEWKRLTRVPPDELRRALQPTYIRLLPTVDGGGRPFEFAAGDHTYAIRALGRDGRPDSVNAIYVPASTESFDADIVYTNGRFLRVPNGLDRVSPR